MLVVGLVDPHLLGSQAHFKAYSPQDFQALNTLLEQFEACAFTPQVMTEVAYFTGKIPGGKGKQVKNILIGLVNHWPEFLIHSKSAMSRREFAWLDLADCSLLETNGAACTLISTDAKLVNRRLELSLPAINFNHFLEDNGML